MATRARVKVLLVHAGHQVDVRDLDALQRYAYAVIQLLAKHNFATIARIEEWVNK